MGNLPGLVPKGGAFARFTSLISRHMWVGGGRSLGLHGLPSYMYVHNPMVRANECDVVVHVLGS